MISKILNFFKKSVKKFKKNTIFIKYSLYIVKKHLRNIGLKIVDYSDLQERVLIREYYNVSIDYMSLRNFQAVIHYRFF